MIIVCPTCGSETELPPGRQTAKSGAFPGKVHLEKHSCSNCGYDGKYGWFAK